MGFITSALILYHSYSVKYLRLFAAPLAWLGSISYSLYLLHVPIGGRIVNIGKRFAHDDLGYLGVALIAMLCSFLAAYVCYWLVEVPAMRLAQKLLPSQSSAA